MDISKNKIQHIDGLEIIIWLPLDFIIVRQPSVFGTISLDKQSFRFWVFAFGYQETPKQLESSSHWRRALWRHCLSVIHPFLPDTSLLRLHHFVVTGSSYFTIRKITIYVSIEQDFNCIILFSAFKYIRWVTHWI